MRSGFVQNQIVTWNKESSRSLGNVGTTAVNTQDSLKTQKSISVIVFRLPKIAGE